MWMFCRSWVLRVAANLAGSYEQAVALAQEEGYEAAARRPRG